MIKSSLLCSIFFLLPFVLFGQGSEKEAQQIFRQAETEHGQGRWNEAISLCSRAITINPKFGDAYLLRGNAREQVRDYKGALLDYSLFLELEPDDYDALLARANTRYKLGQYEEAKKDYLKLLDLPPGETNTVMFQKSASASGSMQITTAQSDLKPVLFNYIGMTELKLNRFDHALRWLDSAIARRPGEADYYVNRGMAKEKIPGADAESDYKKAIAINPNHTGALNNLGVLNNKKGGRGSDEFFDKAIESDSSMLAPYLERAYHRMQGGFFKGALEDYNSAVALEKNDPEIWLNRGYVRERLNDLKGAYADYTQALDLDGQYGKAWLNRGNVLLKLNRFKEAIEDYSAALTFNPEYGSAYYNRAVAHDKLKQKTEACADAHKAESLGVKVDAKLKTSACK